jgi:gentisate 1,2-dioxygenase
MNIIEKTLKNIFLFYFIMEDYITCYEYENNVNPVLENTSVFEKNISSCDYGITFINFSNLFNVNYKATTPNLLASFIKIEKDNNKQLINKDESDIFNGTSHLFYILNGYGKMLIDQEEYLIAHNDILVTPFFEEINISNDGEDDLQIYYINDSPLVNYLGNKCIKKIFKTAVYTNKYLIEQLNLLSNPNNNRKGILLSNKDTEKLGINTVTPVLWALYNELPPNTVQKPHKHNSVALDLCIKCSDSDNVYTLMGDELDENGNIINPTKVNWKEGSMFITPPGLWHSHNNIGNSFAYVLPVQDAGLLLYQRILGIVLKK